MFKGKLRWIHRSRSSIHILMICGLITLIVQICIYIVLYSSRSEFGWAFQVSSSYFSDPVDDLDIINKVFSEFDLYLAITDDTFLKQIDTRNNIHKALRVCDVCQFLTYGSLQFAVDKPILDEVLDALRNLNFDVIEYKNIKPVSYSRDINPNSTIAYIVKRYASFFIVVLYRKEDNVWWYGNINSDVKAQSKLSSVGVPYSFIEHIPATKHEGVLDKFETISRELTGTHVDFLFPKNISQFLMDSHSSKYIECNWDRARTFENSFSRPQSSSAQRFRHRAWKLLSKVKGVFQSLGIRFWLSSGTLLGFLRECDIISHSKDVDIGVMADSYTESLQHVMSSHGFRLIIQLGKPEDSFELSFVDQSGIKLDVFFFYSNPDGSMWNGGTQVKSGKKFKYTFPRFDLCWTLFRGLKVRVPCSTETYIEANYGPNWFIPVTEWDWKSSPFNVQPNGVWPKEEWPNVIKVFK